MNNSAILESQNRDIREEREQSRRLTASLLITSPTYTFKWANKQTGSVVGRECETVGRRWARHCCAYVSHKHAPYRQQIKLFVASQLSSLGKLDPLFCLLFGPDLN